MRLVEQVLEAARQTPASRNRAADCYRTLAICFVVFGHWMLVAPYAPEGELELRKILAEQPWTQYLTWLFQVMPVFFFVGGYANAASWSSSRKSIELMGKRAAAPSAAAGGAAYSGLGRGCGDRLSVRG